jgi:hypothetical protein
VKLSAKVPDVARQVRGAGAQYVRDLRAASIIATDRASKDAQRAVQDRIRGVGLGRLSGAVGQTSSKREGIAGGDKPYGAIYARGGDDSLAGGALESYTRGAVITAQNGQWLAIATKAVPKFLSASGRRTRTTPDLYREYIGPLTFKPIGQNKAVLVIDKAAVNIKTGRARAPLKRASKTSVNAKDVVAFVLIRVTRRAQRFDKDQVIRPFAQKMPSYIEQALDEIVARRA